jgi:hypothetical protein
MKKIVNKIHIEVELEGQGLVNYNGSKVPARFSKDMKANGKVSTNGTFGKENTYKGTVIDADGNVKPIFVYKKIVSGNLLRKCILGDENDVNALRLSTNDNLRRSFLSQGTSIARGYCVLGNGSLKFKKKSGFSIKDAEQTSDTVTWLETRSAEGKRDETSFFYRETCGFIEYKGRIDVDISGLKFISSDENYDRIAIPDSDINAVVDLINLRYGENSAVFGNWGTSNKNTVGEQGVVLHSRVVSDIIREAIKRIFSINILRASSDCRTKSVRIAIGYSGDVIDLNHTTKFVEIKSIKDYDMLVEGMDFGVEIIPIEAPVLVKIEKKKKA